MNNAEKFKQLFGIYATELWAMPEVDFLKWLNEKVQLIQEDTTSDPIDRQAAIDAFNCTNELIVSGEANAHNVTNYINKVIGKIEALPSAQLKPIKLKVDRELTEEEIKNLKQKIADSPIVLLPSAQPERETGKWERHNTYHGDDTSGSVDPDWRCSECGGRANINEWFMYDLTDFCPNCGADMRGEKDIE